MNLCFGLFFFFSQAAKREGFARECRTSACVASYFYDDDDDDNSREEVWVVKSVTVLLAVCVWAVVQVLEGELHDTPRG